MDEIRHASLFKSTSIYQLKFLRWLLEGLHFVEPHSLLVVAFCIDLVTLELLKAFRFFRLIRLCR